MQKAEEERQEKAAKGEDNPQDKGQEGAENEGGDRVSPYKNVLKEGGSET